MGFSPLVAVLLVGALVNVALAVVGWRRRRETTGATPFVVLTLGIAYWSAFDAVQHSVTDLATVSLVSRVSYLGNLVVPMAAFVFVLAYTGRTDWLTRPVLAFVVGWPTLTFLLALTTPYHGLLWSTRAIRSTEAVMIPASAVGPWFWLNRVIVYGLLLAALVLLGKTVVDSDGTRRRQALLVTAATVLPVVVTVPWLVGASPVPGVTLTPLGFVGTGVLLGLALFAFDSLDLAPVARHAIVEEMRDPVVAVDSQGRIADLNPAAASLLAPDGDGADLLGRPAEGTVHGYAALVSDPASPPPDGGRRTDVTVDADDGQRFFDAQSSQLTDGSDDHVGHLIILRDVTDQRENERKLAQSERWNRTIVDNVPDGIVGLFDDDFVYTRVGGGALDNLDVDSDDFEGAHVSEVHSDTYWDAYRRHFAAVFDGERREFEFSYRGRDYHTLLVPIEDSSGAVVQGVSLVNDVTELRRRERQLAESERQNRTLVDNLPGGLIGLLDGDLRYVRVGGGALADLDMTSADFEGATLREVHTPGFVDSFRDEYEAVFDGERAEFEFSAADLRWRTTLVPVTDAEGGVASILAFTMDVTELRERERQLERQNERLEEFVGVVSHDLRNPLNVIQGRLDLAIELEDAADHVAKASDAADRMEQLIEDLLELARTGSDIDETETLRLSDVAQASWDTIDAPDATLEVGTDAPVEADRSRLRQALENLFRNAVEHGGDAVTVRVVDAPDGFAVVDDGPGFPPDTDVLERGVTTDEDGTGFGLSIVEQVARAHGWHVTATDDESGGARVEFLGV